MKTWTHPGGKLIEVGAETLTQDELFEILIGSGYNGRTAKDIAKELLDNFFGIYGLWNKTFDDLSKIKGLKNGKIKRIAVPYEIGKRIIKETGWNLPAVRKVTLGLPNYSDEGLLAILICSGHREKSPLDLARTLLKKYKSLSGITGENLSELRETSFRGLELLGSRYKYESFLDFEKLHEMAKIKGLGDVKVVRIAAAYEIVRRLLDLIAKE